MSTAPDPTLSQLGRADIERLSTVEIEAARQAGRLRDLLAGLVPNVVHEPIRACPICHRPLEQPAAA